MNINIDSIFSFHQLGNRDNQEDARYPDNDRPDTSLAAFAVCDGVGGNDKGEVASTTVCAAIGEAMKNHKNTDDFSDEDFIDVLKRAYSALDRASNPTNKGMGTTLTFIALHNNGILTAHIGDSRIYQIRPGEGAIYRSEDHTLVNALLRSGNISPEEARIHPKRNVITKCMNANDGTRERDDATAINLQEVAQGDYFLLCSDGVHGMIDDDEIVEIYSSDKTDEEKFNILKELSVNSDDNNTLIQIHIGNVTGETKSEDNEESSDDGENDIVTKKIAKKDNTVHELSAPDSQSKLKSFLSRFFK